MFIQSTEKACWKNGKTVKTEGAILTLGEEKQTVRGFGCCFSELSALALNELSEKDKENFLKNGESTDNLHGGIDALLSTVQMPSGIPVATVAIDGAANAALLAIQILAVTDKELAKKLDDKRKADSKKVLQKDAELAKKLLEA